MMDELEKARQHLLSGDYTCVLCKDDELHTSTQRGVKPLVVWFQSNMNFKDFYAADKVVGKATAFLYVLLGVKAVYAHIMSKMALQVLIENNVVAEYGEIVENIINRKGDGVCPFEAAVLEVNDASAAYMIIQQKMAEMNIAIG